ncbi:MAG: AMP-binding protein [Burkholderiales bacterium]|nr:AMP-binding protein [Burkholderiales bacterium]
MTVPSTTPFIAISKLFATPRAAGHPACVSREGTIGWAKLSSQVGAICTALSARLESRWLIAADDVLEFCASLLGALHAGKRAVIAPNLGEGTLRDLRSAYDASIGTAIPADIDPLTLAPIPWSARQLDPDAAALDLYTSGSSGVPKRVTKRLRQLEAEVQALETCWGAMLADATVISTVPHHHIYGLLFRLLWPLSAGRPFDPALYAEPSGLLHATATYGRIALISSPAHLSRLPELLALDALLPGVRCIFSSGAPLPAACAQQFRLAAGHAPVEVYGSTETGGIGWRQRSDDPHDDLWTPFPQIEFPGSGSEEPRLRSPYLEPGAEVRLDDEITLLADGRFRLGARLDRIAKVEGKRVSLPEMEDQLRRHPWVQDAAATVLSRSRDEVGAAVVLRPRGIDEAKRDRRVVIGALRDFLRAWQDPVAVPKRWRFVAALPLDTRGKLSAAAVRALFEAATAAALPPIRSQRPGPQRIEFELYLPGDLPCFDGHFPGLPVLPGVIQVDWAIRLARRHLGCSGRFRGIDNLRFQSVVVPERALNLLLETSADATRLSFRYTLGERKCSSGTILFRP